jgi:hypothetical protein
MKSVSIAGPQRLGDHLDYLVSYSTVQRRQRGGGWPPPYERACEERREALATVIRVLHIDEPTYEEIVEVTRDLLRDPDFVRVRDVIARALRAVPRLEREDIEALCLIAGPPIPQVKESSPCPS